MDTIGFVASFWWAWLVLAAVCWCYIALNQARRIKKVMNSGFNDADQTFGAFFKGLVPMMLVAIVGTIFFLLFIIGVIVKLLHLVLG